MRELDILAIVDNLDEVIDFVNEELESMGCSPRDMYQIDVCVEEVFSNIANYAYSPDEGPARIRVESKDDPKTITLTFFDRGVPFDPLASEEPDVTLEAEERRIGGLGVFIVKKSMDHVGYEYKDGQNILTIRKQI